MKYLALFLETEAVSKNTIGKEPAKASKGGLRELFREGQNSQEPIGREPSKPSKPPSAGFAGRSDGDIERKVFPIGTRPESAFPFGGRVIEEARKGEMLQAKKVYSHILGAELWLIFDRAFEPQDNLGLYYLEEIILLWDKTPKELRKIHEVNLAFPGGRVIHEGPDQTPHCRPAAARRTRL